MRTVQHLMTFKGGQQEQLSNIFDLLSYGDMMSLSSTCITAYTYIRDHYKELIEQKRIREKNVKECKYPFHKSENKCVYPAVDPIFKSNPHYYCTSCLQIAQCPYCTKSKDFSFTTTTEAQRNENYLRYTQPHSRIKMNNAFKIFTPIEKKISSTNNITKTRLIRKLQCPVLNRKKSPFKPSNICLLCKNPTLIKRLLK